MALVMAATVWDRLEEQAINAVRGRADVDIAARRLLATAGGDAGHPAATGGVRRRRA